MDILPPMDCTAGKPAPSIWYQSYLVGSRLYLQSECRIMLYLSAFQHFSIFSTSRSALSSVQVECHGCRHCVKPTPGWWIQPAFCWDGQAADYVLGHPIFIQPPHLSGAAARGRIQTPKIKLETPPYTPTVTPPLSVQHRFLTLYCMTRYRKPLPTEPTAIAGGHLGGQFVVCINSAFCQL